MEEKEKKIGTIIKTYQGKRKTKNGQEYDVVLVWYRDENGKKQVKIYDRPLVSYYILKDRDSDEAYAPPLYIPEDKVQKVTVYNDLLYRDIAIKTNTLSFYDKTLLHSGENSYEMKNLFRHPLIYDADMNLQDRIISFFQEEYEPDPEYQIHKCYFDIEVDLMPNGFKKNIDGTIGYMGFPEEEVAPCPVNIITLIDDKTNIIHSWVVNNKNNKSLQEFKENAEQFRNEVLDKIHAEDTEEIVNSFIYFCDSEEECIERFFAKLHEIDPDYLGAWNECFDAMTLQNRLAYLYQQKQSIREYAKQNKLSAYKLAQMEACRAICDEKYRHFDDIDVPAYAKYQANKKEKTGKRLDFYNVLDGINWFDMEYYFAVIHASEGKKDSYKLDFIAELLLNKHKLPFYPGQTIKNLAWVKFSQFYEYNVRDVLLLKLLEKVNLDIDTLQRLSEITNTRKEKVFFKSISLTNFVNKYARMEHYVMNCNKNQVYYSKRTDPATGKQFTPPDSFKIDFLGERKALEPTAEYAELFEKKDKFGAVVSDPMLNSSVGDTIFDGFQSMHLFRWVGDQDLSSLYPSIIRAYNLDSLTEVGKFFIRDDMLKKRLKEKYDYFGLFTLSDKDEDALEDEDEDDVEESEKNAGETNDLGPTLTDEIISQNWSALGEKFFMLPSTEEIYNDLDELIKSKN